MNWQQIGAALRNPINWVWLSPMLWQMFQNSQQPDDGLDWQRFIGEQARRYRQDVEDVNKPLDPLSPLKPPANWRGL